MDNPIFGDENSKTIKIVTYTSTAIVGLLGLVTFVLLIAFTFVNEIKMWANFAMIVFLILQLIPLGILLWWQRTSYLDPKMKILMIIIPILFVLGCCVALFYVFGSNYPGQSCFHGGSIKSIGNVPGLPDGLMITGKPENLYRLKDDGCVAVQPSCFYTVNRCIGWDGRLNARCGLYNSTENTCVF